MQRQLAVVVQAETGGGFGGKEEYPSVIALARLAARAEVRGSRCDDLDRREDISATTQAARPSSAALGGLRHRRAPWPRRSRCHGRRRYSASPRRAEPWRAPRGRSVPLSPTCGSPARAVATNAPPNGAFRVRRAADRVRRRDAAESYRRGAGRLSPRPPPTLGVPRGRCDAPPPGAPRRSWIEFLEAASDASGLRPRHSQTRAITRGSHRRRAAGDRHRPGARVARRRIHRLRGEVELA